MIHKHWKKILFSLFALFWNGCSDDSSSDSKELTACDLEQIPTCSRYYQCEDNVTCWANEGDTVLNCSDKQDKDFSITEDEFKSKYYVESERIH